MYAPLDETETTEQEAAREAREAKLLATVSRSKIWRLMRDALCLERERIYNRRPTSTEELWAREGELRQVQRLLHQGPHLVVLYDRYVHEQAAKGEESLATTSRPGEPPDLE